MASNNSCPSCPRCNDTGYMLATGLQCSCGAADRNKRPCPCRGTGVMSSGLRCNCKR